MQTYEIIPFTQANEYERELLIKVEAVAREIARYKITHQRENIGYEAEVLAAKILKRDHVRLAFLNTQMELYHLHGQIDHAQSDYARMTDEAANIIFGAILAFAEDEQ